MSVIGLGLIIIAAALHASWNLVSKLAAEAGTAFVFAHRTIAGVLYLPWVIYAFQQQEVCFTPWVLFILFLTAVLHLVYSISLMKGYQVADLSVVYPVARGTGPLLASIAAVIFFAETLTRNETVGIACVVLGILAIASRGRLKQFLDPQSWPGIRWGIFIGTLIASYSLVDAYAVKALLLAPVIVNWVYSLGAALLLAPTVWWNRAAFYRQMQGKWKHACYVSFASPLAYILVLYALRLGADVSQTAPLREMSMIFATVAGAVLLKDSVGLFRWLGCCLLLTGVILISVG